MLRLNAQDHRWLCIEDLNNPLQIGALIFLDVPEADRASFATTARARIKERLPLTPWSVRYRAAPFHVDSGAWIPNTIDDITDHVRLFPAEHPISRGELKEFVAREVLTPLPRDKAPFRITIFDALGDDLKVHGTVAMMVQHHHAVADGIGFQNVLEILFDSSPQPGNMARQRTRLGAIAPAPFWILTSLMLNLGAYVTERRKRPMRARASQKLEEMKLTSTHKRQRTPRISMLDGPNPKERTYEFSSLDLDAIRRIGTRWGGTVNDVVMTLVGGGVRAHLRSIGALDDLADQSVVALVPRSVRQSTDGEFGNFITMMLPTLGTDIADDHERFRMVQTSMRAEIERSRLIFESTTAYERPFTARARLVPETGTSAGNVSVSNVPGPTTSRWFAGHEVLANFPTPSVVAGQFLNVTLRRYRDTLHVGLMSDPTKITDFAVIVDEMQRLLRVLSE